MAPRRIHVTGGQGSGKTTLARRLHEVTGLPMHELDLVARMGGGNGPERPIADRDAMVAAIAAEDVWITEGVHVGWTDPLLARAEVIVWLDHVSSTDRSGRMIRRFVAGGLHELRTRHGRERFTRVADYLRHSRDLAGSVLRSRAVSPSEPDPLAAALAPWTATTIHCTSSADIDAFVRSLGSGPAVLAERQPGVGT
jgi:hypothetical protein